MIVKDEAAILRRCLESVRDFVSHYVIVDTGSSPDELRAQISIIDEVMAGKIGRTVSQPWMDFAHNRSQALDIARSAYPEAEHLFMIDADDVLVWDGVTSPGSAAGYGVSIRSGSHLYWRTQIFRTDLPWRFRGVVHEFPHLDIAGTTGSLPGVVVQSNREGARSRDPLTYAKDAALLLAAIESGRDPDLHARYAFYLAQSYKDAKMPEAAAEWYERRTLMGGWDQEVYVSLLEWARLSFARGDIDAGLALCDRATKLRPDRREAVHLAVHHLRVAGRYADGIAIVRALDRVSAPDGALFSAPWVYDYGLDDEAAVCAYHVGQYAESLDHAIKANAGAAGYKTDHARIAENIRLAWNALRSNTARSA
jgi:tetratricopeptide (TPR) repeat protein